MTSRKNLQENSSIPTRKAELSIRLSEFEIPPMQDVLLIGRKSPIGPEAVRRMVNALSPEQYEIIHVNHPVFEAIVLRIPILRALSKEKLLPIILEEAEQVGNDEMLIKAQLNITVQVNRSINL